MAETTIKVYDGEELIVDATLCRKTDTGEVGWYDYISEKFHPTPIERNEVGTQYIDTGIARAVDAVPVVLCKDCRSCYDGLDDYCCTNHKGLASITPLSFCSYGERRKENEHPL